MWVVFAVVAMVLASADPSSLSPQQLWEGSHSVASFLNLSKTRHLDIPLQVNVLLAGFSGEGRDQLDLPRRGLEHFFERVASRLEHVVVPIGEEATTLRKIVTRKTGLEYDVQLRFVVLHPMVTVALENLLLQNARPDDDADTLYVDVFRVTSLLHHLLDHLQLANSSYSFFLLNPKPPKDDKRYGYRAGLSRTELAALRADKSWLQKLDVIVKERLAHPTLSLPPFASSTPLTLENDGLGRNWAEWYLRNIPTMTSACRSSQDPSSVETLGCLAHWQVADLSLHGLTRHMARQGALYHLNYLQAVLRNEVPHDCIVDAWMSHERFSFLDVSAGPFEWSPLGSTAVGVRNSITVPRHSFGGVTSRSAVALSKNGEIKKDESLEEDVLLEKKYDALKEVYQLTCLSDAEPKEDVCGVLLEKMKSFDHDLHRQELPRDARASDAWQAEMSALTARGIQHMFAPGVPLFPTPFASRVHVLVHVIRLHNDYDPRATDFFHADDFKSELMRLAVPGQTISVVFKELSVAADRAAAMAFEESLRNTVIPSVELNSGEFQPLRHVYLDSKTLRRKLGNLTLPAPEPAIVLPDREVPVFLFSTSGPHPVFVDKYFQAKALSNVVIATQSNFPAFPSKVQCNGRPIEVDLRDPARELLAAVALHLGGLIPAHISYSPATQCVTQEWLWSVGDSPMSHTSHGRHFGSLQRDLVARNYVLGALEQSLNWTNHAIERLGQARTYRENFVLAKNLTMGVSESLGAVWALWDEVLHETGRLRWEKALRLLPGLDEHTRALMELSERAGRELTRARCAARVSMRAARRGRDEEERGGGGGEGWHAMLVGAAVLDVLAVAAFFIHKRMKKEKVKIN